MGNPTLEGVTLLGSKPAKQCSGQGTSQHKKPGTTDHGRDDDPVATGE